MSKVVNSEELKVQLEAFRGPKGEKGDTGAVDGVDYFAGTPSPLGEASPGTANGLARGDHVHKMPTAGEVGALSTSQVVNNFTTTQAGYAADARALKVLNDEINHYENQQVNISDDAGNQVCAIDFTVNGKFALANFIPNGVTTSEMTLMATEIPSRFRPDSKLSVKMLVADYQGDVGVVQIGTDGSLTVYLPQGWMYGSVFYAVKGE